MRYAEEVKGFIVENFLYGEEREMDEDASFLATGIVDSTGILELVSFLEETYGVSIADDELVPENLDSLKNVEIFLERKISASAGQAAG